MELRNSWIRSAWYDSVFILLPPFFCLMIIFLFPGLFGQTETGNEWVWFLLIVCIDVGHVYSTIYRTYLDKNMISKNKMLFYLSPLLIYFIGVCLYSIHPVCFWRTMAYLAVFHFIRQQYGFLRLYSRKENSSRFSRLTDTVTIYAVTLYPLLHWHLQGKQMFNWFLEGDFAYLNFPELIPLFRILYGCIIATYLVKECWLCFRHRNINVPKNLLMIGTAVSWYMGIVYFQGDLTFTLLNVVSHGIPYYGLVWAHGNRQQELPAAPGWSRLIFQPKNIVIFIGLLLGLAYVEELLWDGLVWKEHYAVFPTSAVLPGIAESKSLMALVIPLLALPQLVHYFIDGFIWKMKKDTFGWSTVLFRS